MFKKSNIWSIMGMTSSVWAQGRWGDSNNDDVEVELADDFEQGDANLEDDELVLRPGDDQYDFDLFGEDKNPGTVLNNILHDMNEATLNIIYKYNIQDETKVVLEDITSPQYMNVIETGTHDEIKEHLAKVIDPLTDKILNAKGSEITATFPHDMVEWIKMTSIVWIKNGGQDDLT